MSEASASTEVTTAARHRSPGLRRMILMIMCLIFAVIALGAVALFLYLRSRDSATPVEVSDVVRRFDTTAAAGPGAAQRGIPKAGVYLYDTTGSEHVDVLGGATHEYPSVTTITVTSTSCGFNWRWDALAERWDESRVCVGPLGDELGSFSSYHEFFGQADHRDFKCAPGSIARPSNSRIGLRWSTNCNGTGASSGGYGENVGIESLCVNGSQVETLHFRETIANEGATRGTSVHDVWVRPDSGLIVRRTVRIDTESDSLIGTARYGEEYVIHLRSLDPVSTSSPDGVDHPAAAANSC